MMLYYITGFFLAVYVILRFRCDLIHAHWAIPTGLLGALTGTLLWKPLIVTIHGSDFRMAMGKSSLLRNIFVFVCKRAIHLNCVSEGIKREIEHLGIQGRKITTIPMGVDEDFLAAGRARSQNSKSEPFTILSNRNLQPIYNVSLLIRAIPIVLKEEPNIRFLIAGDGPERKELERTIRSSNLSSSVQFLGRIPHEKMPALLSETAIYISTSLFDGASVSLLEAMASGAFPIVTDILPNREWIKDGENGFLTSQNEEDILANRIIEAIRNEKLVDESRRRNLSIVEERALWSTNIKRIKEVYSSHQIP
jgi:glycosyltransferase involved in cell wall biosynthesis